jgi:hypothetical protein
MTLSSFWGPPQFEELKLGLGVWSGRYQGADGLWLRWWNEKGDWVLMADERAAQAESLAEQERQRATQAEALVEQERQPGLFHSPERLSMHHSLVLWT